ncbi:hypothetical protein DIPPA_52243 [Diplonema papillatum]|nr:hypothetical protein DIPPA_52243 [Diplonema papillatum]
MTRLPQGSLKLENEAALVIQITWRRHVACMRAQQEREKRDSALRDELQVTRESCAASIQRSWKLRKAKQAHRSASNDVEGQSATTCQRNGPNVIIIQCLFRCHAARRELTARKFVRQKQQRDEHWSSNASAIQAAWVGYKTRRSLKRTAAVVCIQAAFRGHQVRKVCRKQLDENETAVEQEREEAAVIIQKNYARHSSAMVLETKQRTESIGLVSLQDEARSKEENAAARLIQQSYKAHASKEELAARRQQNEAARQDLQEKACFCEENAAAETIQRMFSKNSADQEAGSLRRRSLEQDRADAVIQERQVAATVAQRAYRRASSKAETSAHLLNEADAFDQERNVAAVLIQNACRRRLLKHSADRKVVALRRQSLTAMEHQGNGAVDQERQVAATTLQRAYRRASLNAVPDHVANDADARDQERSAAASIIQSACRQHLEKHSADREVASLRRNSVSAIEQSSEGALDQERQVAATVVQCAYRRACVKVGSEQALNATDACDQERNSAAILIQRACRSRLSQYSADREVVSLRRHSLTATEQLGEGAIDQERQVAATVVQHAYRRVSLTSGPAGEAAKETEACDQERNAAALHIQTATRRHLSTKANENVTINTAEQAACRASPSPQEGALHASCRSDVEKERASLLVTAWARAMLMRKQRHQHRETVLCSESATTIQRAVRKWLSARFCNEAAAQRAVQRDTVQQQDSAAYIQRLYHTARARQLRQALQAQRAAEMDEERIRSYQQTDDYLYGLEMSAASYLQRMTRGYADRSHVGTVSDAGANPYETEPQMTETPASSVAESSAATKTEEFDAEQCAAAVVLQRELCSRTPGLKLRRQAVDEARIRREQRTADNLATQQREAGLVITCSGKQFLSRTEVQTRRAKRCSQREKECKQAKIQEEQRRQDFASTIQRAWRRHQARLEVKSRRRQTEADFETHVKQECQALEIHTARQREHSACAIQRFYRQHNGTADKPSSAPASVTLKVKDEAHTQDHAACVIQTFYRYRLRRRAVVDAKICEKATIKIAESVVMLQAATRGMLARMTARKERVISSASDVLCRVGRATAARIALCILHRRRSDEQAATVIQLCFRRLAARKVLQHRRTTKWDAEHHVMRELAAKIIQRSERSRQAHEKLLANRRHAENKSTAAIAIQRVARGRLARREAAQAAAVRRLAWERWIAQNAAIDITRVTRGYLGRQRVNSIKRLRMTSLCFLQRTGRALFGRCKAFNEYCLALQASRDATRNASAITIQKSWKVSKAVEIRRQLAYEDRQKQFEKRYRAACAARLQRMARGFNARRSFARLSIKLWVAAAFLQAFSRARLSAVATRAKEASRCVNKAALRIQAVYRRTRRKLAQKLEERLLLRAMNSVLVSSILRKEDTERWSVGQAEKVQRAEIAEVNKIAQGLLANRSADFNVHVAALEPHILQEAATSIQKTWRGAAAAHEAKSLRRKRPEAVSPAVLHHENDDILRQYDEARYTYEKSIQGLGSYPLSVAKTPDDPGRSPICFASLSTSVDRFSDWVASTRVLNSWNRLCEKFGFSELLCEEGSKRSDLELLWRCSLDVLTREFLAVPSPSAGQARRRIRTFSALNDNPLNEATDTGTSPLIGAHYVVSPTGSEGRNMYEDYETPARASASRISSLLHPKDDFPKKKKSGALPPVREPATHGTPTAASTTPPSLRPFSPGEEDLVQISLGDSIHNVPRQYITAAFGAPEKNISRYISSVPSGIVSNSGSELAPPGRGRPLLEPLLYTSHSQQSMTREDSALHGVPAAPQDELKSPAFTLSARVMSKNGLSSIVRQANMNDPMVTQICLADLPLTDGDVRPVLQALRFNSNVRSLSLARTLVCDRTAEELATLMQSNTSIVTLDLSSTHITDLGATHLASAIHTSVSLQELCITDTLMTETVKQSLLERLRCKRMSSQVGRIRAPRSSAHHQLMQPSSSQKLLRAAHRQLPASVSPSDTATSLRKATSRSILMGSLSALSSSHNSGSVSGLSDMNFVPAEAAPLLSELQRQRNVVDIKAFTPY